MTQQHSIPQEGEEGTMRTTTLYCIITNTWSSFYPRDRQGRKTDRVVSGKDPMLINLEFTRDGEQGAGLEGSRKPFTYKRNHMACTAFHVTRCKARIVKRLEASVGPFEKPVTLSCVAYLKCVS